MLGAGCLVLAVVDAAPVHMHLVMCVSTADEIKKAAPEDVEPPEDPSGKSTTDCFMSFCFSSLSCVS